MTFFKKEEKRKKLEFSGFFHDIMLRGKMWSFLHENKRQKTSIVVMWQETNVYSVTDLTWFDDTYPGLAAVKVDKMFPLLTSHGNIRDWVRERLHKAFD